jgi:hypothetical protein
MGSRFGSFVLASGSWLAVACGGGDSGTLFGDGGAGLPGDGGAGLPGAGGGGGASSGGRAGGVATGGGPSGAGGEAPCDPRSYDFPGNGVDEDCSGTADDEPEPCDSHAFDIGYSDPNVAARIIRLCRFSEQGSWGVVSARYVKIDGSDLPNPLSHGLLPNFGPNVMPREGQHMLALSTGTARRPGDPGYKSPSGADMSTTAQAPPGFPVDSPACAGVTTEADTQAFDSIALELVLRVPVNVKSFELDFNFYTFEFPEYVCSKFNDFFVILQTPSPPGALRGSIGFDPGNNPISVNSSLLAVCKPQTAAGKTFDCPLGPDMLAGTGFDAASNPAILSTDHGATGWLTVRSPVTPGSELTLRIGLWDMADPLLDSTVLVDNFRWSTRELTAPITEPAK